MIGLFNEIGAVAMTALFCIIRDKKRCANPGQRIVYNFILY